MPRPLRRYTPVEATDASQAKPPKVTDEEALTLLREAVQAMRAARRALEAVATMQRRGRTRRTYWQGIAADSAAVARLLALHEASLAGQLPGR